MGLSGEELFAKQNLETARIHWRELQKFFAKGHVILVDATLDLLTVATKVAEDDSDAVQAWMTQGKLGPVTDAQAKYFFAHEVEFWATVVKPFVLVQTSSSVTLH